MKFTFACLFALTTITTFAQRSAVFEMHLSPEMKYEQTITTNMENTVTYSGSEAFLESLKERNTENPKTSKLLSLSETTFTTGAALPDGRFPIVVEYIKSDRGDGKVVVPDGTKIFGTDSIGQKPVLDSIASTEIPESAHEMVLKSIESIFLQINFPETKLKPGESFSERAPLTIPVAGQNVHLVITTTYTLVSIEKGVARFDLVQEHEMEPMLSKTKITASGAGTGKITFDIKNNYFLEYATDVESTMAIDFEGYTMHLNLKSVLNQNVAISKK